MKWSQEEQEVRYKVDDYVGVKKKRLQAESFWEKYKERLKKNNSRYQVDEGVYQVFSETKMSRI